MGEANNILIIGTGKTGKAIAEQIKKQSEKTNTQKIILANRQAQTALITQSPPNGKIHERRWRMEILQKLQMLQSRKSRKPWRTKSTLIQVWNAQS